jgi:ankyrin repeat protein
MFELQSLVHMAKCHMSNNRCDDEDFAHIYELGLCYAAAYGRMDFLEFFLENGAKDVNNALYMAIACRDRECDTNIFERLRRLGAVIETRMDQHFYLDYFFRFTNFDEQYHALRRVQFYDKFVDQDDYSTDLVNLSLTYGNKNIVRVLYEEGAEVFSYSFQEGLSG